MHNFTSNDLLLYIFNELPNEERDALEKELCYNTTLQKEYFELKSNIAFVEQIQFTPHPKLAQKIVDEVIAASEELHV